MSRLVHNHSTALVAHLGGPSALEAFRLRVEAMTLPRCPFCGGAGEVILSEIYTRTHVLVRCHDCRCSTVQEITGYDLLHERTVTIGEALARATARWSCRKVAAE